MNEVPCTMCDLGPLNPAAAVEEREKRERTQLKSLSHILSSHAPFASSPSSYFPSPFLVLQVNSISARVLRLLLPCRVLLYAKEKLPS